MTQNQINEEYFLSLKSQMTLSNSGEGLDLNVIHSTASAPPALMKHVPLQNYAALLEDQKEYELAAQDTHLVLAKMQAGTGSSIVRDRYLARILGREPGTIKLGAKGTDLIIPQLSQSKPVSLAEAQILQAMGAAGKKFYRTIHWIDLVSAETADSISSIWKNINFSSQNFARQKTVTQLNFPCIGPGGENSSERTAPGGHGLFAHWALKEALHEIPANVKDKVLVISNGEDLSGTPDPIIIGYMRNKKIPILMITTEKTHIDLKGGQIAVGVDVGSEPYITIVEHAQAEKAGQKNLFEQLGLRPEDRKAMFNTNMVLFNLEILSPLLKEEVGRTGEALFFESIRPTLIRNAKRQLDTDGVERQYIQLEGAMGSMLLNLDRHFRSLRKSGVVQFLNVEKERRTQFFAPIKTAFDYFMQFHSDRFRFEPSTYSLVDERPGALPAIKLSDAASKDKYYSDIENVLRTFGGSRILQLDDLMLEGRFALEGVDLRGHVKMTNNSDQTIHLASYLEQHGGVGRKENDFWVIKDQEISIR